MTLGQVFMFYDFSMTPLMLCGNPVLLQLLQQVTKTPLRHLVVPLICYVWLYR